MRATIKTIVLAATGAALIIASPALAQTKRNAVPNNPTFATPFSQNSQSAEAEAWSVRPNVDQFRQIRDGYLKDGPSHNGNGY